MSEIAVTATSSPSMAVLADGAVVVKLEPAHVAKARIDRIVEQETRDGKAYKAITGASVADPSLALPPAIPAGWRHVALVLVLQAVSTIYNGAITTLDRWPREQDSTAGQPIEGRYHAALHQVLRSGVKCRYCEYVAPMDGPDRIVAAIDRLTAALQTAADRTGELHRYPCQAVPPILWPEANQGHRHACIHDAVEQPRGELVEHECRCGMTWTVTDHEPAPTDKSWLRMTSDE